MSTSSYIVYEKDDGYKSIYVRIDGTLWGLGRHLVEGFKEKEVKHLFSRNQAIHSMNDLKKEESNKKWYLSTDKNLNDYYKHLNETDNYVVNDLIVKQLTKTQSKGLVTSFNDNIFNHCNEELTYLFSHKKWLVAGYNLQDFVDLKKVVNLCKSYMLIRSLQERLNEVFIKNANLAPILQFGDMFGLIEMNNEEKKSLQGAMSELNGEVQSIQEVLDRHTQTMRKRCYSLMHIYNKENASVQRFVKCMIKNEPSFSTIENLASEHSSIILSQSLSENLQEKKPTPAKTKI